MDNLARKQEPARPELEYGTVLSTEDSIVVTVPFGDIKAQRAVGCLVEPVAGDTVLVSVDAAGGAWVLSVLARENDAPKTVALEGDSVLRVSEGSLTVAADTGVSCVTGTASLHAEQGEVTVGRMNVVARVLSTQVERVKHVADVVDDISREFTRRVTNYFRFTGEHEDCQAESRRQLVGETMTVQSKNTVITSEEHVKIDGKLIHMG